MSGVGFSGMAREFVQTWQGGGGGGGYPALELWAPTLEQIRDTMAACARSVESGALEPLAAPYTYEGPNVADNVTGDVVSHVYAWGNECLTNEGYRRRCAREGSEHCPPAVPVWAWWVGGVALVGVAAYLAMR